MSNTSMYCVAEIAAEVNMLNSLSQPETLSLKAVQSSCAVDVNANTPTVVGLAARLTG